MSFNYTDEVLDLLLKKTLGASYTASKYIPGQEESVLANIQNEQIFALPITNKNPGNFTWSDPSGVTGGGTVRFLENVIGESNIDYIHIKKYENIPFSSIPGTNYRGWKPNDNDMKEKFNNAITGKSNFQFTITTNIPGSTQMNSSNIAYKPIINNGVLIFIGNAIPDDATITLNELYIYEGYFGIKKLNLTDLEDVASAESIVENSSTLVYDASDDKWKITPPDANINALSDLTDVFIDDAIIKTNDTLVYDATQGKFIIGQVEMDVRFDNLPGMNLTDIQRNDWLITSTIRGDDTITDDHFGEIISYNDSSTYLAIGVPKKAGISNELQSGSVYVYDTRPMDAHNDNPAVSVQIMRPPATAGQEDYVNFGSTVDIGDTYLMIGAPNDDFLDFKGDAVENSGVVYSYLFNNATGNFGGYTQFDKEFTITTILGDPPGIDPYNYTKGITLKNPKGMTVDIPNNTIYIVDQKSPAGVSSYGEIHKLVVDANGDRTAITTLDLDLDNQVYQYIKPYGIVYDSEKTHRYRYDYINTNSPINPTLTYGESPNNKSLSNPNEIKYYDISTAVESGLDGSFDGQYYWIADTDNSRILKLKTDFTIFSNEYPIDMTVDGSDIDTKPLSVAFNSTLKETHVNINYDSTTVSALSDIPIDIKLRDDNATPTLYYLKKQASTGKHYVEKIDVNNQIDVTTITINSGPLASDLFGAISSSNSGFTNGTHTGLELFDNTGNGKKAIVTIVVAGTSITSVTVTTTGQNYQVGSILSIYNNNDFAGLMFILEDSHIDFGNGLSNPTSFTTNITPLVIEKTESIISTVSAINQSRTDGALYVGSVVSNPTNPDPDNIGSSLPITVTGAKSGTASSLATNELTRSDGSSASGAIIDVTISGDGTIASYTIVNPGSGYVAGDTVTIPASSIPGATEGQSATSNIEITLTAENLVSTNSNTVSTTTNSSESNDNSSDNGGEANDTLVDTVVDTEQRGPDIYMLHTTLTNGTVELNGASNNSRMTRKAYEPDSQGNPNWIERPFANGLQFVNARSVIYDPSSVTLYENTIQSLTTVQGKTQPIEQLGKMMKYPLQHQDLNDSDYYIYALDIGNRKLSKLRWDKIKNGEEDFNGLKSNIDLFDDISSTNSGFTEGTYENLELSDSTGIQKKGGIATIVVGSDGVITSVTVTTTGSDYVPGDVLTIYNNSHFDGLIITLDNDHIDTGSTDIITFESDNTLYPTTFAIHSDFGNPDDNTFTSTPYIYIFNSFGTTISRYGLDGTKDNTFEVKTLGFQILDMILDFNNDIIVSKENDNVYRISDSTNYTLFDKNRNIGEIQSGGYVTVESGASAGTYPTIGSNRNDFLDTEAENGDADSCGSGAKVRVVTNAVFVTSVVVLEAGRGYKEGNNLMINASDIGKNDGLPDLKIKLTQKDADALNGPFVRPISTDMVDPTKLKLDSAGNIFVCESGANRISKIMFNGTDYVGRFNVLSEGLNNPVNFELDGDPLDYGFIARRKNALLNAIIGGNSDLPAGTYFNVPTDSDSDYGGGALLTIVVYGGIVTSVTATITGSDYLPGDELYVNIPDEHPSLPTELNSLEFAVTKNHLEGVKMIILDRGSNKIIEANAPSNLEYYDHGIDPMYYLHGDDPNNGFGKFYGSRNIYKVGEIRGEAQGSLTEENRALQLLNEELLDVNKGNSGVSSTIINGEKVYTSGEPIYLQSFNFDVTNPNTTAYMSYQVKMDGSRIGDLVYSTKRNIKELILNNLDANSDEIIHEDGKEYKIIGKNSGPVDLNINVDAYLPNVAQPDMQGVSPGTYDGVYVNIKTACTPASGTGGAGGTGAELTFIIYNDIITTISVTKAGSGYGVGDIIFPEDDDYSGPYDIQITISNVFTVTTNILTPQKQALTIDNTGPDVDNLEINQVSSDVLYRVKSNDLQLGEEIVSGPENSKLSKVQLFNRIKNRMEGYYKIKEVIDDPLYGADSHKYLIRGPNDGSYDGQEMGNVQVYTHNSNYTENHITNTGRFNNLTTDDFIYIYDDDGRLKAKIPIIGIDIDPVTGRRKVRLYPIIPIGSLKRNLFLSIASNNSGFEPGTHADLVLSDETGDGDGGVVTIVVDAGGVITSVRATTTGTGYQSGSELIIYNENDEEDQIPHQVFSGLSIVLQPVDIDTSSADDY